MSHPASIHEPLTVPEAALLIERLALVVGKPGAASKAVVEAVARVSTLFTQDRLGVAARGLIALDASTVSLDPDSPPDALGDYWMQTRSTDDELELLAEAFGELTMGVTTPYWELDLP